MAAGDSGLLHATTGSGKTYAVWFGALARAAALGVPIEAAAAPPLGVLWLTPMRALAADSARALEAPLDDLDIGWSIGIRTGDTAPAERARQDRRFPTVLVTTPESLSLMLTREGARDELAAVHTVIVGFLKRLVELLERAVGLAAAPPKRACTAAAARPRRRRRRPCARPLRPACRRCAARGRAGRRRPASGSPTLRMVSATVCGKPMVSTQSAPTLRGRCRSSPPRSPPARRRAATA